MITVQTKYPLYVCSRTNNPALQNSPPAADLFSDIIPLRRNAIPRRPNRYVQSYLYIDNLRHLIPLRHGNREIGRLVTGIPLIDFQLHGFIGQRLIIIFLTQMSQQDML